MIPKGIKVRAFVHGVQVEGREYTGGIVLNPNETLKEALDPSSWQTQSFDQTIKDLQVMQDRFNRIGIEIYGIQVTGTGAQLRAWKKRWKNIRAIEPLEHPGSFREMPLVPNSSSVTRSQTNTGSHSSKVRLLSADSGSEYVVRPLSRVGELNINAWVPTDGYSLVDADQYSRYTYQYFGWYAPPSNPTYYLRHFRDGSGQDGLNHTYEHETHYDGYDTATNPVTGQQSPAVYASNGGSWDSNLPRAYLDTQIFDDPREPNIAVGSADATQIQPDQWYWSWVRTYVDTNNYVRASNDRISIATQRGYRDPAGCYSALCSYGDGYFTNQWGTRDNDTHLAKRFSAGLVARWLFLPNWDSHPLLQNK